MPFRKAPVPSKAVSAPETVFQDRVNPYARAKPLSPATTRKSCAIQWQ